MLFEENDFDINMAFFMPDVDFKISKKERFYQPMEGFLRGNMFRDEYRSYKNLTYFKLDPINEKENDLFKIMALDFAINDFNLYLDLNPNDMEVFELFKKYMAEKKIKAKEYEKKYGSLELRNTTGAKYDWLNSPWPWDSMGGSLYV